MDMNVEELPQYELIELIKTAVEELKSRELEAGIEDDGFDTVNTIAYLVNKYDYIFEQRKAD